MTRQSTMATQEDDRSRPREAALDHDIAIVNDVLRQHLGANLVACVLGGGFGRGEGRFWERDGRLVPANDLDVYVVVRRPVEASLLLQWQRELAARTLVDAVDLLPRCESELPVLPATMENVDLKVGHRVILGDPQLLDCVPAYTADCLPLWEGENLLRNRLVTLLEGYPEGVRAERATYQSAKAVLAAIDAQLVRTRQYTTRYRDKVRQFRHCPIDGLGMTDAAALADHALAIKVGASASSAVSSAASSAVSSAASSAVSPLEFWHGARRFFLASLVSFFDGAPPGDANVLTRLLRRFQIRSVSLRRTVKNGARGLLGKNSLLRLDRLMLALCVHAEGDRRHPDLDRWARQCGLPGGDRDALRVQAIQKWYALRKGP